jgi:hypothetical protein
MTMKIDTAPQPRTEGYQSYLLRLWKDQNAPGWRASLQDVTTHECHNFANLSTLLSFIFGQVGQAILEDQPEIYEPYRQAGRKTPVFQPISKRVIKNPVFHELTFEEV